MRRPYSVLFASRPARHHIAVERTQRKRVSPKVRDGRVDHYDVVDFFECCLVRPLLLQAVTVDIPCVCLCCNCTRLRHPPALPAGVVLTSSYR